MALDKEFKEIPGTIIFDAEQSRKGYWLNQFCMSLMKAENRARFKANERAYLDGWKMSEEQKQAVLDRDLNRMMALGGNIYFLSKIGATDGKSFQQMAGSMTGMSEQDYRDIVDGPFDAISSIGMFEHVGGARLDEYFERLFALLRPQGRLLNHGIARHWGRPRFARRGFVDKYVFPDGELHEVGSVVSRVQRAGFEVRHVEGLREHYDRTLRHWVANLEAHWDEAVRHAGEGRARVWRLYMAGSACLFAEARIQIHQVLAVRNDDAGRSGLPLRPDW